MWNELFTQALITGGLISLWMTIVVVISLWWNPEIWVHDYPPEIRAALPPKSERATRQTLWVSIPAFGVLLGLLVWLVVQLYAIAGGFPGFWEVALAVWIAMQTFNVFDLLALDWLMIETWRPRFVFMPGTEPFADRRFYGFHFRGFLKGSVGITLVSLVLAAVLWGVDWVL